MVIGTSASTPGASSTSTVRVEETRTSTSLRAVQPNPGSQ